MSKLLLLYSTIVVSLVFLLVPNNDVAVGFLLSDMTVSVEYYIYSIFEKCVMIILAYIIANEAQEYEQAIWIFFWLMVADLVDYLIGYNSVWFYIQRVPISMNVFKSAIFGLVIIRELWKQRTS